MRQNDRSPPLAPATGLAAVAPFPIGTCVNTWQVYKDKRYVAALLRDFNSITAEREMKMNVLQPEPGRFAFEKADSLLLFARRHNLRVHGHTLVWQQVPPAWLTTFQGDSAAWEQLLQNHIQTTLRHFKGKVKAWDVVNEAWDETGAMVPGLWQKHLGPGYVARAFRYARAADPTALLFYNDYSLDGNPNKLNAVLQRLDALKAQGVPIDGVGVQMHILLYTYTPSVVECLRQLSARGYLIHVSEMDVALNPYNHPTTQQPTPELLAAQRAKYQEIVAAYRQVPARQQYGITLWGLYDGATSYRDAPNHMEWPLLLDDNFQPKPAYAGFEQGLH